MSMWRVIYSTISFGKRVELIGELVFGDTAERAESQAEACGFKDVTGYKFERVEPAR